MLLDEASEIALVHANFIIDDISDYSSIADAGEQYVALSAQYRALGICELLVEGDVDAFFHRLIDSALTRKHYLARCASEGLTEEPERRSSLLDPLFDAVAANQLKLASEIATLTTSSRVEDFEDDIDFTYSRVAHALVAPGPTSLTGALASYEAALEGDSDARLAVARALSERDAKAFAASFPRLIDAFEAFMQKRESSSESRDAPFLPNRHVFVEGLALLRLADHLGLRTEKEYALCPSLARAASYRPYVPASFPNLALT